MIVLARGWATPEKGKTRAKDGDHERKQKPTSTDIGEGQVAGPTVLPEATVAMPRDVVVGM